MQLKNVALSASDSCDGSHRNNLQTACNWEGMAKAGEDKTTKQFKSLYDGYHSHPSTLLATAYSPGGCSLISAYSTGLGSAFGIGLGITVTVSLTPSSRNDRRISIFGQHHSARGAKLIGECLDGISKLCSFLNSFSAQVTIKSTLPIARGLKSSSALANATVLAAASAVGLTLDHGRIMTIARDAELNAACSRFGSVDDGFATLMGGVVFADSTARRLIDRYQLHDDLDVVVMSPPASDRCIPEGARESMKRFRAEFIKLHLEALEGHIFRAMTLSGLLHASQFGYDTTVILDAMKNGAKGATLSGKGPAFVALVREPYTSAVVNAWKKRGNEIVLTRIENTGATAYPEANKFNPKEASNESFTK